MKIEYKSKTNIHTLFNKIKIRNIVKHFTSSMITAYLLNNNFLTLRTDNKLSKYIMNFILHAPFAFPLLERELKGA